MDPEEFRRLGHQMVDFIADYYKGLEQHPVLSQVEPGYLRKLLPSEAPQEPETFEAVMEDVKSKIMPGITHWQSPNFFAYFPAASSCPGILGEMLSACFNVIGFSWISSPACTELETIVTDWIGRAVGLNEHFLSQGKGGGVIQGSASESTLVALLAARSRTLAQHKEDPNAMLKLVAYVSTETHSSVQKACMIAGVQHVRIIGTDDSFAMLPSALETQIKSDLENGLIPCFVTATIGTTSSTAIDPIPTIATLCAPLSIWVHVDAAYAGSAFLCPEYRHFAEGVDLADSFCFNAHKWMLTNFDCSLFWTKDRSSLLDALSITPEYLRSRAYEAGLVSDYRDWQIPLGRRFRAVKLWMVVRMLGIQGIQKYIRMHCDLAQKFESWVAAESGKFTLSAPRTFSLVCFRLVGTDAENEELLNNLNKSGSMYIVHTKLKGVYTLRFCVGSVLTEERHVDEAWEKIKQEADKIIAKRAN
eukprot:GILI01010590.1.p1 GENE.GILI01010590.1~~GILI01010590.1.p1  ORF type:complete len:509 (-),score=126.26 GILI01010590.1:127-1551(-)